MLLLIPWLLMSCIIITEGLTVTSISSSPIINGSSVTLKFCNYSLSSGESITSIQWKFRPEGASSFTTMATYTPLLDFEAQGNYIGKLTHPDSNSGFLLYNGMTLSDRGNYSCDIVTNLAQSSSISEEKVFVLPSDLDFPCNGSVNQVHNCSLADKGEPPATLTLTHSSGGSTASSITGIVQLLVTSPGNVTCTVTLTGFPTYDTGIPPVTCPVNASSETTTAASETITPTSVNISALSSTGIPDTSTDSTINTTISTGLSTSVGTPFSTTVGTTVGTAETTFASSSISPSSIRESTVTGEPGGESSSMPTSSGEQSTWQSIPTTKPSPTVSDNGNSNYSLTGAVVGGCIGGIVILIGVAAIIIYRRHSCNCRGKDTSPDSRKPIKHMNTRL